jgi:predicted aspartyl protease
MGITARRCTGIIFALVVCSSALAATPPDNSSALPVRTLHDYLMVISLNINQTGPFDFLLDTGTTTTLIDPELAQELALKPVDRMALTSLANSVPVPRYFLKTLTAGPASVAHLEALATPLPELRALDRRIRGVLGMNFLMQFSFRLDYANHRLELWTVPETAPVPAGLRLRAEINDWRILVPVMSDAAPHGVWKLALDSGISQMLVFQERMRPGGAQCSPGMACVMQVATNLSTQSAQTVLLPEIAISEARLRDVPVVVLRNDLLNQTDPQDGLLPASLFRSIFFDRGSATLVLSTN